MRIGRNTTDHPPTIPNTARIKSSPDISCRAPKTARMARTHFTNPRLARPFECNPQSRSGTECTVSSTRRRPSTPISPNETLTPRGRNPSGRFASRRCDSRCAPVCKGDAPPNFRKRTALIPLNFFRINSYRPRAGSRRADGRTRGRPRGPSCPSRSHRNCGTATCSSRRAPRPRRS